MERDGTPEAEEVGRRWESALMHASASMDDLRWIHPARMFLLNESGYRAIKSAMDSIQLGVAELHRAGRHVLGASSYESFVADRMTDRLDSMDLIGHADGLPLDLEPGQREQIRDLLHSFAEGVDPDDLIDCDQTGNFEERT